MFSPARSLSATGELTQLLGNSGVLLFIHQAESNVLVVKIVQDLGCKLDEAAQTETGETGSTGDKEKVAFSIT